MCGCVFRAAGSDFDVDEYLKGSCIVPLLVVRRGDMHGPSNSREMSEFSGFTANVSERECSDLDGQINDAKIFIEKNMTDLQTLQSIQTVENIRFDFSYQLKIGKKIDGQEILLQSEYLPSDLLKAAGNLGISIELSLYPK